MCIMLRRCGHGIITLQWPASSVCILSLSIDCCSPFFVVKTTARSPTRKYTQIVDRPKDVQVEQATSHLTRPLQSLALATIDVHLEHTGGGYKGGGGAIN